MARAWVTITLDTTPASVVVTLDTTAPVITWGGTAGTTAGELFRVGYTLNEPALLSAALVLADGRELELIDTGLTLEALLPPDTPSGPATVRALVRDDLDNEAVRELRLPLGGVVAVPEEIPGRPAGPRRGGAAPGRRRVVVGRVSRGTGRVWDGSIQVRARARAAQVASAVGRYVVVPATVRITPGTFERRIVGNLVAYATARTLATRVGASRSLLRASGRGIVGEVAIARRDGRLVEEWLLLELL